MNDNKEYIEIIQKLAKGYEYEETQTLIEETASGTKKKVIRYKKYQHPNFQATTYLMGLNKIKTTKEEIVEPYVGEVYGFNVEKF